MKYKVSPKKISYLYRYVSIGEYIGDAAIKAGYSRSYSSKINSYESWIAILHRIEQIDAMDKYYKKVCNEVQILQEYYREQSKKSKTFN